jgi:hypothetical protein
MATEMPVILGIDAAWTEQDTRQMTPGLEPGTSARAESVHPRHAHRGHVAMHDAGARLEPDSAAMS